MASLSIGHSFLTIKSSSNHQETKSKNCPRFLVHLACQNHEPVEETSTPKTKKEEKGSRNLRLVSRLFTGVEKFGKGLKKNLSPQQKGDWKDLVLMSLSFAVYVYISEMIVCAYFSWMSMPKQSW
ncbi:putative RNA/RNP complex-1-interacting phosphatase [Melia azedarach]|uniref:RNA/RNP complex-1-interacting phosphatase n=1 Tax=Melia azedarach TaxID=155640 RepID=A0ACC1XMR6_MELAZ|nr:putative RNA/RNP complex-1-interacting phosphatase [Melia azedarach]